VQVGALSGLAGLVSSVGEALRADDDAEPVPAVRTAQSLAAVPYSDDPSDLATYVLIAVTILTALGAGFAASRAARRFRE
jgi:hypothetical protein